MTRSGRPLTLIPAAQRPDAATASTYPLRNPGSTLEFFVGGTYDDKLANTPDGWRFVHRIWNRVWSS